ncbi:glycosyltransferase family 4 protein [Ancylobacter defluvii]|uniref:Colanic acid biosynthesis glycosyltransferase WcaL n=1 Tax=Ancylobacter defluvii TaxID=1282440 RepID=A0A9W6JUR2_9HYPH|nr:glycosyltransferase family 4 protein [Ancylobacter defluvii]MBS7585749.1 glycosyltransferase family 4 protein [Ancylobacter defluvii]GLK84121.1 colanic acid biosynthesis glycosyltransferase WcaL [Ancylobacter defluvii]
MQARLREDGAGLAPVSHGEGTSPRLAIVLKGYPRLSETFIAQEILALEQAGYVFDIWSLRRPTDRYRHPMHEQITARLFYLPEYLRDDPRRVMRGLGHVLWRLNWRALLPVFLRDLARDFSASRVRRLGQALVLAREVDPAIRHLHVHFLHTPASVTRYAAILTDRSFSFSAHAKDIWTTPDWERREKIAGARWGVTCTRDGWSELRRVAEPGTRERVELVYHGLDLARFPQPPDSREPVDGSDPTRPVQLLAVGRAVEKKGFDDLLAALGRLPPALHWQLVHIGGGELLDTLKARAAELGLTERIEWRGSQAQGAVVEAMRQADLFVLPSRPAGDGDRDGLPNVLMEAATQALPAISTDFAGVPEFIENGVNGVLVQPKAPVELAEALATLIADPAERQRLGQAAYQRLISAFSFEAGISRLDELMGPFAAARPRS